MKNFLNKFILNKPIISLTEIPNRLLNKISSTLQFPPSGFARYHVTKFIISSSKKYDEENKKILDVGAGHQPYKNYFNKCIYESCDNKEVIDNVKYDIKDIKHTFYSDINIKGI